MIIGIERVNKQSEMCIINAKQTLVYIITRDVSSGFVWDCDSNNSLKYFLIRNVLKWFFFYFLKIIFNFSTLKLSENIKNILNKIKFKIFKNIVYISFPTHHQFEGQAVASADWLVFGRYINGGPKITMQQIRAALAVRI